MIGLSLFNGIDGARLAAEIAGFKIDKWYVSEIDKYANQISKFNFPDNIHVGDVRKIEGRAFKNIDLLIGGSPCQDFSFAGKQAGSSTKCKIEVTSLGQYLELKKEGFEFQGQSYLFWEYVRILKGCNPKYFLLENVKMSKKWQNVISEALGVKPILINSALVSAQNRQRLYWTNIPCVGQPKENGVLLKDIVFKDSLFRGQACCRMVGRKINPDTGKRDDYNENLKTEQRIELRTDNKSGALTTVQKDNLVFTFPVCLHNLHGGFGHHSDTENNKNSAVVVNFFKGVPYNVLKQNGLIRKFDTIECERLQTFPDNFTAKGIDDKGKEVNISKTQRYKALGNGFTVNVIAHILSHL